MLLGKPATEEDIAHAASECEVEELVVVAPFALDAEEAVVPLPLGDHESLERLDLPLEQLLEVARRQL